MKNNSLKIGIVAGFKASDAALCLAVEQSFTNVKIVRYRIPFGFWLPWILKKIKEVGVFILLGHLALSGFLRTQRLFEKFNKKSLWLKYSSYVPVWSLVKSQHQACFSEEQVNKYLEGSDCLIFLDSVRFSHDFFRKFKIPILQIIWSNSPKYYGDSGVFWAYGLKDFQNVGVSIVLRKSSFSKLIILKTADIPHNGKEDLRTIKIKQVLAVSNELPQAIVESLSINPISGFQKASCRIFRPPTLPIYLAFLRKHTLENIPQYAFKKLMCKIKVHHSSV